MRIAFIVPRIDRLGPIFVIQTLVNSLRNFKNLEMKLYYIDKHVDTDIKFNVPVERLDPYRFNFKDFDIIHTNGIRPDLFAYLNRKKIRYHISTIHNFVFQDLSFAYNKRVSWIFGYIWLFIWKRADKLACVSYAMKSYYAKWFSLIKLEVIYNGIIEPDFSLMADNDILKLIKRFHSKGLKIIGSAGILTKRKGIDQVLHIVAEDKEFALIIIGSGKELSNLKRLAGKLKISDRCLFCGFRSNAVNYFRYFDFYIVPSRSEGFGLTLIEAVQQKVPVICSDIEVFRELFNSDEVTFFKLDDNASLTVALDIAMKTGKIKADLAYSRYKDKYTAHHMAERYYELFKSA